jgi:hypothetical protein
MRVDVGLIDFYFAALERRLALALFGDTLTNFAKYRAGRAVRDAV